MNYRIPKEPDPNTHYIEVPHAKKYVVCENGHMYRILKSGKIRQLKAWTPHGNSRRFTVRHVAYTKDDGKRTSGDPRRLYDNLLKQESRLRDVPQDYIELPDLWIRYSVNKYGEVLHLRKDLSGEIYFEPVPYRKEKPNGRYKLERVLLRTDEYTRRSYTRAQLQRMYEERMNHLVEIEEQKHWIL